MIWTDVLDPGSPGDPKIPGTVRIHAHEVLDRPHELPPRGSRVRVLDGPHAALAMSALESLGRAPAPASEAPSEADPNAVYRLWRPSSWVESACGDLPAGDAVDLGCGAGRDAVWLADRGWRVRAIDRLPDALDLARGLQGRYAPAAIVEWLCGDASDLEGDYDLAVLTMCFSPRMLAAAMGSLWPGGRAVIEAFTPENRAATGRPSNPDWTTTLAQLGSLGELLAGDEGWRGERHTVRAVLLKR